MRLFAFACVCVCVHLRVLFAIDRVRARRELHLKNNDAERDLLALPARLGGIALVNPTQATYTEFLSSTKITEALKEAIIQQDFQYTSEVVAQRFEAKTDVHKLRREQARQASDYFKVRLPHSLKRSMDLA